MISNSTEVIKYGSLFSKSAANHVHVFPGIYLSFNLTFDLIVLAVPWIFIASRFVTGMMLTEFIYINHCNA